MHSNLQARFTPRSFFRCVSIHAPRSLPLGLLLALGLLVPPHAGCGADAIPGYVVLPLTLMGRANQATIRVAINGRPTMLILDTGSSTLALDSAFYHGATRQATPASDQLPAGVSRRTHANGEQAEVGSISSLTAGPMNFGGGPVIITDLSGLFGQYNNYHGAGSVAGLLGEDVLHRYSAIIDWRRRGVYFNTNPAKRMKLGPGLIAAGWTAIPMAATSSHRFTVPCTVSGKQARLLVDTGAGYTSFAPGIVPLSIIYNRDTGGSMLHLASTSQLIQMIGLDTETHPAEVDHWKIGSYEIASSYVSVHKFPRVLSRTTPLIPAPP